MWLRVASLAVLATAAAAVPDVALHPCGGVCKNHDGSTPRQRFLLAVGSDRLGIRRFDIALLLVPSYYAHGRHPAYVLDTLCRLQDMGWILLDLDRLPQTTNAVRAPRVLLADSVSSTVVLVAETLPLMARALCSHEDTHELRVCALCMGAVDGCPRILLSWFNSGLHTERSTPGLCATPVPPPPSSLCLSITTLYVPSSDNT